MIWKLVGLYDIYINKRKLWTVCAHGGNFLRNLEWTLSIKQFNFAVVGDQTTSHVQ